MRGEGGLVEEERRRRSRWVVRWWWVCASAARQPRVFVPPTLCFPCDVRLRDDTSSLFSVLSRPSKRRILDFIALATECSVAIFFSASAFCPHCESKVPSFFAPESSFAALRNVARPSHRIAPDLPPAAFRAQHAGFCPACTFGESERWLIAPTASPE